MLATLGLERNRRVLLSKGAVLVNELPPSLTSLRPFATLLVFVRFHLFV